MEPDGDGTRFTLTEQGAYFTEEDQVEGSKEGTEGLLDSLQAFVEGN